MVVRVTRAISVFYRRNLDRRLQAGFTLLELLVVLTLAALSVGLVAPAALRSIDAARERGWAQDLTATLASLPVRAHARGEPLVVDAAALRRLLPELPEDWQLETEQPLLYSATGMAGGGRVRLQPPGRAAVSWFVQPLTGEPLKVDGAAR